MTTRKLWPGRDEYRGPQHALFLVVYTVAVGAWCLFWAFWLIMVGWLIVAAIIEHI
jgi:hypothetical protein